MRSLAATNRGRPPARALAGLAALVLLVQLTPAAPGQDTEPSLLLTLDEEELHLHAASTTQLEGTIRYADPAPALAAGATDADIDLQLDLPEGWTGRVEPAAFRLAPGQRASFTLTLTAPTEGQGATDADARITATANAAAGRTATTTASIALARIDPPAAAPPWHETPAGIATFATAALLLATAVGYAIHARRRAARQAADRAAWLDRETGITLALAGDPTPYGHRRETAYRLAITNQSQRPRVAILDIAHTSPGWRAATQLAKLPLSPGETQHVTLVVTPEPTIRPGEQGAITLRARPEEAREHDERLHLAPIAPHASLPTDPHHRIVTRPRDAPPTPRRP